MKPKGLLKTTFASLKHKDFRVFWLGQSVSTIGSMIQVTALSWYVYKISGSPFLLGLMGVFEFGPVLLLSLFTGVFIERFSKRKVLIFTQSLFLVQSFALALLVWHGCTAYWPFALLALLAGISTSIDQPTRQSFFVELVGKKDLPNAISLNSTSFNLARIIGPAIAGALMRYVGIAECFFINGLSFIPIIYGISLIRTKSKPVVTSKKRHVLKDIASGLRYTAGNSTLWPTFVILLVVCTFAMNANVVMPIFAKDVMLGNEQTYSLVVSCMGLGSLLGALFMAGVGSRIRLRNFLVIIAFIMAGAEMLTLIPVPEKYHLAYFLPLIVVMGFCNLCFLNRANTRIQLNTDDAYRSRVMSIYIMMVTGSTPLGNAFIGWAISLAGERYGFFICGFCSMLIVAIIYGIYRKLIVKAKVVQ